MTAYLSTVEQVPLPGSRSLVRSVIEDAGLGIGSVARFEGGYSKKWREFLVTLGIDIEDDASSGSDDTVQFPTPLDAVLIRNGGSFSGNLYGDDIGSRLVELLTRLRPGGSLVVIDPISSDEAKGRHEPQCWSKLLGPLPGALKCRELKRSYFSPTSWKCLLTGRSRDRVQILSLETPAEGISNETWRSAVKSVITQHSRCCEKHEMTSDEDRMAA